MIDSYFKKKNLAYLSPKAFEVVISRPTLTVVCFGGDRNLVRTTHTANVQNQGPRYWAYQHWAGRSLCHLGVVKTTRAPGVLTAPSILRFPETTLLPILFDNEHNAGVRSKTLRYWVFSPITELTRLSPPDGRPVIYDWRHSSSRLPH